MASISHNNPNIIYLSNTIARFDGPAKHQADQLLRYRKSGYQFTRAYKLGAWDGWVRLLRSDGRFPAGLAPWVAQRLRQQGIKVAVEDQRPPVPEPIPALAELPSTIELRPHQVAAVAQAEEDERGIIYHPTAAGKTVVMGELARRIARPGLVLVHRKDLLYQAADRFVEQFALGKPRSQEVVGVIGDGLWHPRLLTVATFQTLHLRLKERDPNVIDWLRDDIYQVHVDECHHVPAQTYERVLAMLRSARWRFGYSATPWKEGDMETFFKVASWLGSTIHHVAPEVLTEAGRLVPADVFMIRLPGPPLSYPDWQSAIHFGIVNNGVRNQMIVDLAHHLDETRTGPTVILVERLAHGQALANMLGTDFVAGDAPTSVRQEAWDALRSRRRNLLVTSKIADEGLDIPPLTYLILAGGGKAQHLTVQRVGRGMRTAEGKDGLFVFDFLDTGKYLGKHADARKETYASQGAYSLTVCNFEEVCP